MSREIIVMARLKEYAIIQYNLSIYGLVRHITVVTAIIVLFVNGHVSLQCT